MSGTSPLSPSSPENQTGPQTPLPAAFPTRTLAIIKSHAVKHRLTIERRIIEAGFEIIKERQMQFHPQGDRDALTDLFGKDAESLNEDPVWVYILERRRAVEVWNTLMGDEDPEEARLNAPNSLRAVYGQSLLNNAFIGSPDNVTAEKQIASLFASSPPFPPTEMPEDRFGSVTSVSSSVLASLRGIGSDEGGASITSVPSSGVTGSAKKAGFKARPAPPTTHTPTSQPRTTRSAALRAGLAVSPSPRGARSPPSAERIAETFANVPGHKRRETITVASTQAPTISPRATRASALRTGAAPPPRRHSTALERSQTFAGVPGHKRSETVQVASVQPPAIAPRPTRASTLRTGKPAPPTITKRPSTSSGTTNTFEGVPGHKRSETVQVASVQAPVVPPRTNRSASLRAQKDAAPPSSFMFKGPTARPSLSRQSSQTSLNGKAEPSRLTVSQSAPALSVQSSRSARSPATSPRAPDITPRTNRSALLRAKMGTPTSSKTPIRSFV